MEEYFCISLQTAACWCQLRQIYNRILGFCQDPPESMRRSTTWDNSSFMPSRSHRPLPPTRTQFRIILSLWDSQGIVRNTVSHLFKTPQAQFSLAYHSKLAQVIVYFYENNFLQPLSPLFGSICVGNLPNFAETSSFLLEFLVILLRLLSFLVLDFFTSRLRHGHLAI